MMSQSTHHAKIQGFVATLTAIVADRDAVRRASRRDLAVIEGVLLVILDSVTAELKRRDQQESRAQ